MKEGKLIKGIIIAIIGVMALIIVQRVFLVFISPYIPAKTGGTAMYLIYEDKKDTYYKVIKNNQIIAIFHSEDEAKKFANKINGNVEIFTAGK